MELEIIGVAMLLKPNLMLPALPKKLICFKKPKPLRHHHIINDDIIYNEITLYGLTWDDYIQGFYLNKHYLQGTVVPDFIDRDTGFKLMNNKLVVNELVKPYFNDWLFSENLW